MTAYVHYNPDGTGLEVTLNPMGKHPNLTFDYLGYIPDWLSHKELMNLPAKEAINKCYQHGGGWNKFEGFEIVLSVNGVMLRYPEYPDMYPIAHYLRRRLNNVTEPVYQFPHGWVLANDEVARIN